MNSIVLGELTLTAILEVVNVIVLGGLVVYYLILRHQTEHDQYMAELEGKWKP